MATDRFGLQIDARTVGASEVEKLTKALQGWASTASDVEKRTKQSMRFDNVQGTIERALSDPLNTAGDAAKGLLEKIGPLGVGIAGFTTVAAGAGIAMFNLAKRTGELAERQSNAASTMGLTVKEYGLFETAADNAGVGGENLIGIMKALSQALSDNSDEGRKGKQALHDIGVEATNAFGAVKPTKQLILEIADALGGMTTATERNLAGQKIFGRPFLQIAPLMNKELRGTLQELEKLGVGFDEAGAATAKRFDDALDRLTTRLKTFTKEAGVAIATAAGFEDPQQTEQRERENARRRAARFAAVPRYNVRTGQYEQAPDLDLTQAEMLGAARRLGPGGVSLENVQAANESSKRQQIARLLEDTDKLQKAQKSLEDAVRDNDVEGVRRAQARIAAIEAENKALQERKTLVSELESLEKRANTATSDSLEKVILEYREFSKNLKGQDLARAQAAFRKLFDVEFQKELKDTSDKWADLTQKAQAYFDALRQADAAEGVKKLEDTARKLTEAAKAYAELTKYTIPAAGITREADAAIRLTQARAAISGPYAQAGATGAVEQIRLNAAKQLYDLELKRAAAEDNAITRGSILAKARADYEDARFAAELEHAEKLLELERQRNEAIRQSAGELYDALRAGGAGLRQFVLGQAEVWSKTIFQNTAVELGRGLSGKFTMPGQLGGNGQLNTFGRILQGTPFGMSPEKIAVDLNTQATTMNTQAVMAMTGALSGMSGGATAAGISRVFGGYQGGGAFSFGGGAESIPFGSFQSDLGGGYAAMMGYPITPAKASIPMWQKGIGYGAIAAGAGMGVYSGIRQGGAQGALTASSSLTGGVAGILALAGVSGPAAPILGAVALGLGVGAMLFGDPKKKRAEGLENERNSRAYTEPTGTSYVSDQYGRTIDYDYTGRTRGGTTIVQNVTISAMDAKSFDEFADRNNVSFASAVTKAISGGNAEDLVGTLRQIG